MLYIVLKFWRNSDANCSPLWHVGSVTGSVTGVTSVLLHTLNCTSKEVHCESKKQHTKLLSTTSPNINRFSYFFHWWTGLGSKFATNSCLNIPPRLKHVATLPCEIWMSEKWHQSEICIVINDKSRAKHLRKDYLLLLHIYHSICWWKNF